MPLSFENLRRVTGMSLAWGAAGVVCAGIATLLAVHHPLWPVAVLVALVGWIALAYHAPTAWLVALPAGLPVLNLSPWTGWIGIEEFDILVLGAVAAGYAHQALQRERVQGSRAELTAWAALAALTLFGLMRGVADAGTWQFGWYQGYIEPLNSFRVAKSLLWALLLWPLLRAALQADRAAALNRMGLGMLLGMAAMALGALWERAAFPGLLNIASPYRTVALFWEMHVGGAAIDAYLVLATPFAAWALWAAHTRAVWIGAALFALVWAYVALTTFSRGAYLGIAVAMLVLGLLLPLARRSRWATLARSAALLAGAALLLALVLDEWGHEATAVTMVGLASLAWLRWRHGAQRRQRRLAASLLALALIFEAVLMFGPDSFMGRRAANSAADYESRTAHWARGLALLDGPMDWLLGLGLGRLPAHYGRAAPGGEFPGSVEWRAEHVQLSGPRSRAELGVRFGLTQRVPVQSRYRMTMHVRTDRSAQVLVRVCESHLLYVGACQWARFSVMPSEDRAWTTLDLALRGPALSNGPVWAPRQAVLTLSVINPGGGVELDKLRLLSPRGIDLLANGDFTDGLAHWLPAAQSYFLPWHIDNLVLEVLIERGLIGAGTILGLALYALRQLLKQADSGDPMAPFFAAALGGVGVMGLLSSVFDVPRVALLALMLAAIGLGPYSSKPT